ncbi:hypothetical protein FB567DRAFT_351884 [Paraphoma chrysanthemicola]|uniref:Uncharacterized protein n=1 Tax=Paraphoma chrysanthemicola TaxID=798071 RepID=A0A8K0R8Z8_9PLEO|nr:hypothetical protein FB567DRAFT_351884 [Paraphoma chrysanthemicola]
MAEERKYDFVLSSPIEETLPPYSSTWASDVTEEKDSKTLSWPSRRLKCPLPESWKLKCRVAASQTKSTMDVAWKYSRDRAWPLAKRVRLSWKQVNALALVIIFAVLPLALLGYFTPRDNAGYGVQPFYGIFQDKVLGCGNSFGVPENATIRGVERLFALDTTFGQFSFGQAKTIDVVWDVMIGRGVQLLAWYIGYIVFSDALLRIIERHATSFQIFQRIALEGPSLLSLWTLVRELWCARSKRTRFLFFYMWLSTLYITSIPMLLSAMTGYDATSIAWVSLSEDNNNIVPSAALERTVYVTGTLDKSFDEPVCVDYALSWSMDQARMMRWDLCDCRLSNGTMLNPPRRDQWGSTIYSADDDYIKRRYQCRFDYPGNNQTFNEAMYRYGYSYKDKILPCGSSFNITIGGNNYDALSLNYTDGWCHDNKAFEYMALYDKTRCLPDTNDPSYQWGFSTMLSGLFVFFHFGWAVTMYIVWQDAQFNSSLVKSGYEMTPLRAAFAMAKAAKRKTGMGEKQLVRANTKELEQELYGTRKTKGTKVDHKIFAEGDDEEGDLPPTLVRRNIVPKRDEGFSEVSLASDSSSTLNTK